MISNFYAEQAFLQAQIVSISEQRKKLNEIVSFFKGLDRYEGFVRFMSKQRCLPEWIIRESDCFLIDEFMPIKDIPEEYRHESYGLCRGNYILYHGRAVYPVKDCSGDVMGFCGWDPVVQPKYMDSKNYGYKAKSTSLYGMENIAEYYKSDSPVFVVEGLVDSLVIRSLGFQALATLGSGLSMYQAAILKRFGRRLVVVPDNDNYDGTKSESTAGEHYVKQVLYSIPDAKVFQPVNFNDLNDIIKAGGEHANALKEDLANINNIFYPFKELRQRTKGLRYHG